MNATLRTASRAQLVVFSEDYEHNTEDDFVVFDRGATDDSFTLKTGNLIGYVSGHIDEYPFRLTISSRFGDEFLRCLVAEAEGFVEIKDHGSEARGSYHWLLVYLWSCYLKHAYRLGLPKAYVTRDASLSIVRGAIDPLDFTSAGKTGRYHCTYREHSYDNEVTRLIARTLTHLDGHAMLNGLHKLRQEFEQATMGRIHPVPQLLLTRQNRNPYFSDYNRVVDLSKRILRNQLSGFGEENATNALFFDVSMLFEFCVRKVLRRGGALFHEKSNSGQVIATGVCDRRIIPDFVFEIGGRIFVFDAKYKNFDFRWGIGREDLFQLHTYVGQWSNSFDVAGCGFVYPVSDGKWRQEGLERTQGVLVQELRQHGHSLPLIVAFLRVPNAEVTATHEFPTQFHESCQRFADAVLNACRAAARSKIKKRAYAPKAVSVE